MRKNSVLFYLARKICLSFIQASALILSCSILFISVSSWGAECRILLSDTDKFNQAVKRIKDGESWEDLWKSKEFSDAEKLLIYDQAAVKRTRPSKRPLTPIEQTLIWETEKNHQINQRRASIQIPVAVKSLKSSQVEIYESSKLPSWLKRVFIHEGQVLAPMNPFNESTKVPFLKAPDHHIEWSGYLTASRTMVFHHGKQAFAVKMPTDYTSPQNIRLRDASKANMTEDVQQGTARSAMIEHIDSMIGEDRRLKVLKEVLAIADPQTGNGIVVRDLSPMMDGNHYLPGTATYHVFKEMGSEQLIQALQQSAYNQGQAQALMLIRYGLEFEYPHRQNSLDQLTASMQMTDVSVVRDVADTQLVGPVAQIIIPEAIARDKQINIQIRSEAKPDDKSIKALHGLIDLAETIRLTKILNSAYSKTISQELGISEGIGIDTPVFQEAVRRYHERLRQNR